MSQAKLQAAKELIDEKEYRAARAILETLTNDATAIKWLARLNEMSPPPNRCAWEYCEIVAKYEDGIISATKVPFGGEPKTLATVSASALEFSPFGLLIMANRGAGELGKDGWEIIYVDTDRSKDPVVSRTIVMKRMITR